MRITVVFNNVPHTPGLETSWGFAAVIETRDHAVLFDTGGDRTILISNMERLGVDPTSIDTVVLSHIHFDHTGGLERFLEHNPNVSVWMPKSFPDPFKDRVKAVGAKPEMVRQPVHIGGPFYSTGEMGPGIKEQALIVDTAQGLIVMTGCAHPGIVKMAAAAREYLAKDIYLLMGGFHMLGMSDREVRSVVDRLTELGVRNVAPSHCTGDEAIAAFQAAWGEHFIAGGCGAVIQVR